ncbi:hypothetical protein E2C01_032295 [Portunus trituberculatus]|uniref:Uncharacterized protein n=1 Tax=Portunus trituberculatus TaxID=210409 RepID=A0A5B7EUZ3_PORTR|nr:hypothetical protein [Portunus trituberculatus]
MHNCVEVYVEVFSLESTPHCYMEGELLQCKEWKDRHFSSPFSSASSVSCGVLRLLLGYCSRVDICGVSGGSVSICCRKVLDGEEDTVWTFVEVEAPKATYPNVWGG